MDTLTLAAVLLFITGSVNAQVLDPRNAAVLQNTDARFNCSVRTSNWVVMTWTVNGRLALAISEISGPMSNPANYSATNYTTPGDYKWEFRIKSVNMTADNTAVTVGCQVSDNLSVPATLVVQQNGTLAATGPNRTATEGEQVTFQCLAEGWSPAAQLSWAVNGVPVYNVPYYVSSAGGGILMNSNSTLKFTAQSNATVNCLASISALPSPAISSVFLTVQKAVPRNQTVLIAITVAFSLAALLALLIILIVFCCKRRRRKRSAYEREVRAHSHRQQATYPERGRVRENLGYVEDQPGATNLDGVYAISGYRRGNYPNNIQHPDVNSSQYTGSSMYDGYSLDDPRPQKHRHLTLV